MGISFLYIGRDEHILKDRLPVDPRSDESRLEVGYKGTMGIIKAPNSATSLNFASALAAFGLPPNTDLIKIVPELQGDSMRLIHSSTSH